MSGEIVSSGGACQERSISSFPRRGMWQLWICFGIKYAASLEVHESKAKKEVCSLQFLEARAIREGSDSSKARLFLCQNI
jgi:hypothetical protein